MERLRENLDRYLTEHPRAKTSTPERSVRAKAAQLKLEAWLTVEVEGRSLKLRVNQPALDGISRLDGCYVLKTDLPQSAATKKVIHDRYKDLEKSSKPFASARPLTSKLVPFMCARPTTPAAMCWS